jgi:hypothetical protein
MAPFSIGSAELGIIFSTSGEREVPKPEQLGQAPSVLLKEKCLGVRRGMAVPVSGSWGSVEKESSG